MKTNRLSDTATYTVSWNDLNESLLMEGPFGAPVDKARAKEAKLAKRNESKIDKIVAGDFSSYCARATFYINNNYAKPYDQAEWKKLFTETEKKLKEQSKTDPDKAAAATTKFRQTIANAIVVGNDDFYIRRGLENMKHKGLQFAPGANDKITNGFFVGDYKYKKWNGAPASTTKGGKSSGNSSKLSETNLKRFLELAELVNIKLKDGEGKEVELKDVTLENILTLTVVAGTVETPAKQWLQAAKKKKLI